MDGGWYWITDEENTAVSFLIPKAARANTRIAPVNPGSPGLTFTVSPDGSVSFLREAATGRVGILPHLLPLPAEEAPPRCGQYKEGEEENEVTRQRTDDCLLDAAYSIRLTRGPGTGPDSALRSGQIFRPMSGTTILTLGLYGDGHLDLADPLGAGFDESLMAFWTVNARVEGAVGPPRTIEADRVWGISADLSNNLLTVHNTADSDGVCAEQENYTVALEIKATAGENAVLPTVPGETRNGDFRPRTVLRVRCPAPAAALGRELVPADPLAAETERSGA